MRNLKVQTKGILKKAADFIYHIVRRCKNFFFPMIMMYYVTRQPLHKNHVENHTIAKYSMSAARKHSEGSAIGEIGA